MLLRLTRRCITLLSHVLPGTEAASQEVDGPSLLTLRRSKRSAHDSVEGDTVRNVLQ